MPGVPNRSYGYVIRLRTRALKNLDGRRFANSGATAAPLGAGHDLDHYKPQRDLRVRLCFSDHRGGQLLINFIGQSYRPTKSVPDGIPGESGLCSRACGSVEFAEFAAEMSLPSVTGPRDFAPLAWFALI
jgi:hypothetical protein